MPPPDPSQRIVLCCARKKGCPAAEALPDGRFRLWDDDQGAELVLEREQLALLLTWGAERLRGAR